ncbi:MAG: phosphoribosylformylglycinamidine cyclo-ligase, partial [Actinomycetes bacterium]
AVELMKASVSRATRPEVLGDLGGFAGLFDASALARYRRPLLATSTDGVGTKVAVAQAMDVHHTIGIDLVAMVVDDLVVVGAEPLFMTDYIACGSVVPERIAAIVTGIARGCELAGCALLGGETAEHPGLLGVDEYDVAGAGTAVVEADDLLGPARVVAGDVVIAMRSSGLHSNGYSLARHVLLGAAGPGWSLDRHVDEFGRSLGEEMLEPTRIYSLDCLDLARAQDVDVHAFAHITGGGIAANIARVLPSDLHIDIDRPCWTPHPVFTVIGDVGSVAVAELERTFNMGIGMVAVVAPESVSPSLARLASRGVDAWVCGAVRDRGAGDVSDAPAKGGRGGSVTLRDHYRT